MTIGVMSNNHNTAAHQAEETLSSCNESTQYNGQSENNGNSGQRRKQQFACLYTKHKTQKRKMWNDGRLVLLSRSCQAILYSANPTPGSGDPALNQCELSKQQVDSIVQGHEQELEMEKFLVTIEGPWVMPVPVHVARSTGNPSSMSNLTNKSTSTSRGIIASKSMKKVMTSKFRKPGNYVPPRRHWNGWQQSLALVKRKRPLQPGELEKQFYGDQQQPQSTQHPNGYQQQQRHPQNNYKNLYRSPSGAGGPAPMRAPAALTKGREDRLEGSESNHHKDTVFMAPVSNQHMNSDDHHQQLHEGTGNGENTCYPITGPPNNSLGPSRDDRIPDQFYCVGENNNAQEQQKKQHFDDTSKSSSRFNADRHHSMEQETEPPRKGQHQQNVFVRDNGFDPTSFYGDDEEEEEDEEVLPDTRESGWTFASTSTSSAHDLSRLPPRPPPTSSLVNPDGLNHRLADEKGEKAAAGPLSPPEQNTTAGSSSALSTSELLSLFGVNAGPAVDNMHQKEGCSLDTKRNRESRGNIPCDTTTTAKRKTFPEMTTTLGQGDDFILPPLSDSSSDENSSQET